MNKLNNWRWHSAVGGLLVIGVILLSGCGGVDEQQQFEQRANRPPEGFTETTEGGKVVNRDPDDWSTAPIYQGVIEFDPAYPNPVDSPGDRVTLLFHVIFEDIQGGLLLRAFDNSSPPRFIPLDEVPDAQQGFWQFDFNPTVLSTTGDLSSIKGLHRLYVFDSQNNLVTYGDLKIDPSTE